MAATILLSVLSKDYRGVQALGGAAGAARMLVEAALHGGKYCGRSVVNFDLCG